MPESSVISSVPEHSTNKSESRPRAPDYIAKKMIGGENFLPAICKLSQKSDAPPLTDQIDQARLMGFNAIGISGSDSNLETVATIAASGLAVVYDLDIVNFHIEQDLLAEHPDWFAHDHRGPRFVFLAENDPSVDWWAGKIEEFVTAGVTHFCCLNVASTPATIWKRLITATKVINGTIDFIAWTPGATPEQLTRIKDVGFAFSVSSSCWWDYRSAWLEDDAARIGKIGAVMALVSAPNSLWPSYESLRFRDLATAAFYGAAWQMPFGFERGDHFDLASDVKALNHLRSRFSSSFSDGRAKLISSAGAQLALLSRDAADSKLLLGVNASTTSSFTLNMPDISPVVGSTIFKALGRGGEPDEKMTKSLPVPPAGIQFFDAKISRSITWQATGEPECSAPRIAIESVAPKVNNGEFPVRRIVGEALTVEANIISDGHDKLAAEVLWRAVDQTDWQKAPMLALGNDKWQATFQLDRVGRYMFKVSAWKDRYATFVDELSKKHLAGVDTHLELAEGMNLLREIVANSLSTAAKILFDIIAKLESAVDENKLNEFLNGEIAILVRELDPKPFLIHSPEVMVDAERAQAAFASWYEIFPRSQSGDPNRHGTFNDVIEQLPRIVDMGFDVLYFPPIHPIGRVHRKGKNNTLTPGPEDPGSPYAIGSSDGGHDAIHPELGTLDDFLALRKAAESCGIELAIDFAIQCAPDHPWLKEHKEWFDWRPDGSIRYAENPPKKYEDIVNVDFYADGSKPSLWLALRDVVQFWVEQGIRLFRVDNPHTKPFPFWEWMISDIRSRNPDVVFLAEAFTRPNVMYRLAKIGFSQSYTYFTWRNTKAELTEYITELNTTSPKEFFRPHFFVNTPDINPPFLQNSGRPGFLIRAALAATLSGLWGVYNGFELCEATPVPGKEEYLNSEKYEIKAWDYDRSGNITAEIASLNRIRRSNRALHSHLGTVFLQASNENVLFYSRTAADGNILLVAVSLDPYGVQESTIDLPLFSFELPDSGALAAEDLMRDHKFIWYGKTQTVVLNPELPFCIWRVQTIGALE